MRARVQRPTRHGVGQRIYDRIYEACEAAISKSINDQDINPNHNHGPRGYFRAIAVVKQAAGDAIIDAVLTRRARPPRARRTKDPRQS